MFITAMIADMVGVVVVDETGTNFQMLETLNPCELGLESSNRYG